MRQTIINLPQTEMPRQWYNIVADMPNPSSPRSTRARRSRSAPRT